MDPTADEQQIVDIVGELQYAWLNEKFAPELLPHKETLVTHALAAAQEQAGFIADLPESKTLKRAIYEMELERINFVIRQYLRIRINKIEKFALHLSKSDEAQLRLTEHEQAFLQGYVQLYHKHVERSVWATMEGSKELPDPVRDVALTSNNSLMVLPKLDSFVFCRVNRNCDPFTLPNSTEVVELNAGSTLMLPYRPIQHLVQDGSVQLI